MSQTPPLVTKRSPEPPDGGTEEEDVGRITHVGIERIEAPPQSRWESARKHPAARIAAISTVITAVLAGIGGLVTVVTPLVKSWFEFRGSDDRQAIRIDNAELRLQRCEEQIGALRMQSEQRFRFLEGATCELGITYMGGFCALDFYATPKDPSLPRTARGVEIAPWHALPPAMLKPVPGGAD